MLYAVCTEQQLCEPPNPYEVRRSAAFISRFFELEFRLPDAVALLHLWLRSAISMPCCLKKKDVINIFYFREQCCRLIEAAAVLYQNADAASFHEKRGHAISLLDPKNVIANMNKGLDLWDSFPRHLSRSEIINPYRALQKCFRHKSIDDWQRFLEELYTAATGDSSIITSSNETDMYESCCCLFKLLEACHFLKMKSDEDSAGNK